MAMKVRREQRRTLGFIAALGMTYSASTFAQSKSNSGFRLDVASLATQKYEEKSSRDSDGDSAEVSDIDATGIQLAAVLYYDKYELLIQSRSFSPQGLDYLSKRSETTTALAYHYPKLPWTSLIFGYYRWSQTGKEDTEDAPAAFVATNTALVFGLGLEPDLYSFSPAHRIFAYSRSSFFTSLEKDRNYGTENQVGAGYKFQEGKGAIGLYFGYIKESFQAERLEKDLTTFMRSESTYAGYMLGLQLSYR
jgi:hypothetical protein